MNLSHEKCDASLTDFVEEFYHDRINDYQKIKAALNKNDLTTIYEIAHRLKGFCAPYGFKLLGEISENITKAVNDKNHGEIEVLIESIGQYLEEKEKYITKKA